MPDSIRPASARLTSLPNTVEGMDGALGCPSQSALVLASEDDDELRTHDLSRPTRPPRMAHPSCWLQPAHGFIDGSTASRQRGGSPAARPGHHVGGRSLRAAGVERWRRSVFQAELHRLGGGLTKDLGNGYQSEIEAGGDAAAGAALPSTPSGS